MLDTPLRDRLTSTPEGLRTWHQERSIFETTEMICELMDEQCVNRAELARRLGTTKSYITKLLDGSVNMTLRTISDVFVVLGYEFHPRCSRLKEPAAIGMRAAEFSGEWQPDKEAWQAFDRASGVQFIG